MASSSSSSSSQPSFNFVYQPDGSESGWVEARTHCDYLAFLSSDLTHIPTPNTPCYRSTLNDMSFLPDKHLIIQPSEVDDELKLIGSHQHCFIFDMRKGNCKFFCCQLSPPPPLSSQTPVFNLEIYKKIMLAPDSACILFDFTSFLCFNKFKDQPLEVCLSTNGDNESQNMIVYIHIMPPDSTTCTHVGLIGDIRGMNVIPQELIEGIVSHTSPLDACDKAVSDQWMFYGSCKRTNLDTLQAFPTEKVIDDGVMYFWLDKLSWNKCFSILFPLSTMVLKSLSPRWLLPVNTVHTCVDLMGDVSGMNVLPQELIEDIVSRTSPVDVCGNLSIVSRKFRSAAKSDHVWERFLPADLISRRAKPSESHFKVYAEDPWKTIDSDTLQAFTSKKDLYLFLSDNPLLIDGDMYFWLDRLSGSKCFLLVPEKLSIPEPDGWHGPYSYYELTLPFRIEGKISTSLLSPNTLYTAYLWFDFTCSGYFTGFGEEEPLQTCVGIDGGCESESRIVYIPFMPCEYERHTNILKCRPPNMPILSGPQYPRRRYAIYELELGDYFNKDGGGDNRELKMCLSEIKTGEVKGGICLYGIEIKPKNCQKIKSSFDSIL